ncbi:O-Glycosyl hydrolases family 17 protein [Artemisia annua]|uniref:O-Glycosyl hydrolases family 17 protein n=1 Tax=Artemisia annua TaxID=35608 RepID=A0A2U1KEL7_ARTAN|nr:O-Glycosyl hydrolases family 17 protein [Artemisia annua]
MPTPPAATYLALHPQDSKRFFQMCQDKWVGMVNLFELKRAFKYLIITCRVSVRPKVTNGIAAARGSTTNTVIVRPKVTNGIAAARGSTTNTVIVTDSLKKPGCLFAYVRECYSLEYVDKCDMEELICSGAKECHWKVSLQVCVVRGSLWISCSWIKSSFTKADWYIADIKNETENAYFSLLDVTTFEGHKWYNQHSDQPSTIKIQTERRTNVKEERLRNRVPLNMLLHMKRETQKRVRFTTDASILRIDAIIGCFFNRCRVGGTKLAQGYPLAIPEPGKQPSSTLGLTGITFSSLQFSLFHVDAVRSALNAMGFKDIDIVVAEIGWAYEGDRNEARPSVDNAKAYNGNLINHLRSNVGTPLMPEKSVDTYILAIHDENLKPGGRL